MGDPDKRWLLTTPDGKTLEYTSIAELLKDAQALHALDPRPASGGAAPAPATTPSVVPMPVPFVTPEEPEMLSSRELVSDREPPVESPPQREPRSDESTAEVVVPKMPSRPPSRPPQRDEDVVRDESAERARPKSEPPAKAKSEPPPKPASEPPRAKSEPPPKPPSKPPSDVVISEREEEPVPLSARDLEVAEPAETSSEEVAEISLSDVTVAPAVEPEGDEEEEAQSVEPDEMDNGPVSLDPSLLEEAPASTPRGESKRASGSLPPANPPPKKKKSTATSVRPAAAPEQKSSGLTMVGLAAAVAVVFVGAIAYLSNPAPTAPQNGTPSANVPQLTQVVEAEQALADGDLQGAQERLDKVAQGDPNPRVLIDLARVANARADMTWLTLRVLRAGAPEEAATREKLRDLSRKAREAAEAAVVAAPADPTAVRAKLDALRLANEVEAARALIDFVASGRPYEAETDYVLAALDLAETSPPLPEIIVRLRAAADREGKLARARIALVHALTLAGDLPAAQVELDKLARITPPHPLLEVLRANVPTRGGATPPLTTSTNPAPTDSAPLAPSQAAPTSAAPSASPGATASPGAGSKPATSASAANASASATPGDPASLHRAAITARRKGDFARATQLYEEALRKNPGDSEALTGLGDTLRAQGDAAGAVTKYRSALGVNPKYLPAALGLADALWDSGQRGEAQAKYQEIANNYSADLVPDRVKQRANP